MQISAQKFYENCRDNGYQYALDALTAAYNAGMPSSFLPECGGARSMCRIASYGIEGLPFDCKVEFLETKFGFDLYMKMFGDFDYDKE